MSRIHFLNVDEGDCSIIEHGNGKVTMIDICCGDSDKDFRFLDVMKPRITLMGNAKSKFLAYDECSNRGLSHITNNQAGNILIEFEKGSMYISISNKVFADNFC